MKKIILKSFLVFVFGLFILTPNLIRAEENEQTACRNSYISNVLPGANSKVNSFKYFLLELKKDVDINSVKFYINEEEQNVSVVEKVNGLGYLGIIEADQNLSKAGTLLLEVAASGLNENKCNDNFFVGLEMVEPVVVKNTGSNKPVVPIEETVTKETLGEKIIIAEGETLEQFGDSLKNENEDNNQTALILNASKEINTKFNNSGVLEFLIPLLIIIVLLALLYKRREKKK